MSKKKYLKINKIKMKTQIVTKIFIIKIKLMNKVYYQNQVTVKKFYTMIKNLKKLNLKNEYSCLI